MAENGFFRLSYSKIACYQQCRKQYWFKYVSGEEWPPQVDSPASLIGTGVHRAMRVLSESDDVEAARARPDAKHPRTGFREGGDAGIVGALPGDDPERHVARHHRQVLRRDEHHRARRPGPSHSRPAHHGARR